MADAAYLAALKLLSRRELSAAQVRQRLRRQGHSSDAIEGVIVRLVSDGSNDDRRVAGAIARTEVNIRRRGAHRVRRQIESAGIDTTIAQEAIEEVFASVDPDVVLEAALTKRLRRGADLAEPADFRRVFRHLVGQGFEPDRVLACLKKAQRSRS